MTGTPASSTAALASEHLLVLTAKGEPLVQRSRSGSRAFAAEDMTAACRLLGALTDADPTTRIERFTTADLVAWLCGATVGELVVASATGDTRCKVEPLGVAVDACPLVMIVDLGDRPGRDCESSHELFRLRRERVVSGDISPLALDAWFLCDQDVFIPCHPEMLARQAWPRFEPRKGPRGENLAAFEFFTTIEAASKRAGAGGRVMAMGGRDALRWAFATPVGLDSIVIDPGQETEVVLGRSRVLAALFPATLPFERPTDLPALELCDLTSSLPFDPSTALVAGTLLRHWRDLIGPTSAAPEGKAPVGFTTQAAFVAAMSSTRHPLQNAVSPAEHAPFRAWLQFTRATGKVVLDPASPAPLELTSAQVFLLALWCESQRSIEADEFTTSLVREHRRGHFDAVTLARLAAAWPTWIVGESEVRGSTSDTRPWIANADGRLMLFASEGRLAAFVESERAHGRLRHSWRAHRLPQLPGSNLFELAQREYAGLVIDGGGDSVVLEGEQLDRAIDALMFAVWPSHLRPRRRVRT
jgi:hypothetical protein